MSKLDIGVGEEFPLEEGQPEEGRHFRHSHHRHRGRHHHDHHHFAHRHRHFPRFPLIALFVLAVLFGMGKLAAIPALAIGGSLIALASVAFFLRHRRGHALVCRH